MAQSQTLTAYLNQWVKTATKDRVIFSGYVIGSLASEYAFYCRTCKKIFKIADPASFFIPSELQDWVKEHRHVCKKYVNSCSGIQGECATCKWSYGAHEESWQSTKPTWGDYNVKYTDLSELKAETDCNHKIISHTIINGDVWDHCAICQKIWTPKQKLVKMEEPKPKIVPPLPEVKGRKFRD